MTQSTALVADAPDKRGKSRRSWLLGAGAVTIAAVGCVWLEWRSMQSTLPAPGSGTSMIGPTDYREIQWDDLIPKEWDPTRRLRKADGSLNDMDPKAQAMLQDLRAVWDNAPTVHDMDGVWVKLPGYVVPLDEVQGGLKEFLLVPYFGACIHTPPPPANQIVHVVAQTPVTGFGAMDTVWVSGRLSTARDDSPMGASGYRLAALVVEAYRPHPS